MRLLPRPRVAPLRALALGTALSFGPGCGGEATGERPTAEAERGSIERIVVATGTIEPAREVEVRPRIPGIIEKIHVEAGDTVTANQVVVEIERDLLEAQVREAQASLAQARVERRYAKIEVNRAEELERGGAASPQQGDTARSRVESAHAAVARAQAVLDNLETQLGYATVLSPLAGRVLDVHVEEGSAVSPVTAVTGGTLLVSLAATDRLHLQGLVDENEISRVRVGQTARIRTEAFGDRVFPGQVSKIAPIGKRVENVTYFEVEIQIEPEHATDLRPRMSGDGEIVADVVQDAIVVPERALRYGADGVFVEVVSEDGDAQSESRDVTLGIVDGSRVQVLSGVEAGERVVLPQ